MLCPLDNKTLCQGFDCQPHPCVTFLRMDQKLYDSLKEYTVWATVQKACPNDDPEPAIESPIPKSDLTALLEIVRLAIDADMGNRLEDEICDQMDISEDELNRLKKILNTYLNG